MTEEDETSVNGQALGRFEGAASKKAGGIAANRPEVLIAIALTCWRRSSC
jgi:hypothetical protein